MAFGEGRHQRPEGHEDSPADIIPQPFVFVRRHLDRAVTVAIAVMLLHISVSISCRPGDSLPHDLQDSGRRCRNRSRCSSFDADRPSLLVSTDQAPTVLHYVRDH